MEGRIKLCFTSSVCHVMPCVVRIADIFASALKMCVVVGLVIADATADATRADAIGPPPIFKIDSKERFFRNPATCNFQSDIKIYMYYILYISGILTF